MRNGVTNGARPNVPYPFPFPSSVVKACIGQTSDPMHLAAGISQRLMHAISGKRFGHVGAA